MITSPLAPQPHIPVLLDEVIAALSLDDGERMIDGTFGNGGYSEAVLSTTGASVLALDRDPNSRHQSGVLECADLSKMNRMKAAMDRLSPMSPVRRKLELSIFSRAHEIVFDTDGRTVVPKPLRNAAGLEGAIYFQGCGKSFEIWNAKVHEAEPANPADWTGEEEQAFDKAWAESRAAEGTRP